MREVGPGIVSREFDELDEARGPVWSPVNRAELLLPIDQWDSLLKRNRNKSWHELDARALNGLGEMLQLTVSIDIDSMAGKMVRSGHSPEASQAISDGLAAYHDALPVTRTERRWLAKAFEEAFASKRESWAGALDVVGEMKGEIVSAGKHQTAVGSELLGRLWDWWRQADGYEPGAGSLDAAETALQGLIRLYRGDEDASR